MPDAVAEAPPVAVNREPSTVNPVAAPPRERLVALDVFRGLTIAAMLLVNNPGSWDAGALVLDQPDKTLAAWIDRAVLGTNHIWASSKTWDPEGPLSTLPAIATVLLGILAGQWITRKERPLVERVAGLYAAGC